MNTPHENGCLLVTLHENKKVNEFLDNIKPHLNSIVLLSIQRMTPFVPLYKICFEPPTDVALQKMIDICNVFAQDSEPSSSIQ